MGEEGQLIENEEKEHDGETLVSSQCLQLRTSQVSNLGLFRGSLL